MSNLKFYKDKKGDIRWRISARIAGKKKIVDASTEGFKRTSGAIKNLKASGARIIEVMEVWVKEKAGTELERALREFKASRVRK